MTALGTPAPPAPPSEPVAQPRWWREPGTRWIGMVLLLLLGNIGMVGWLFIQAGPISARRVLPDYYQRAAAYDGEIAQRKTNRALGWRVEIAASTTRWHVELHDQQGEVRDAAVSLQIRHRTEASLDREVKLMPQASGYDIELVMPPSVYDVEVTAMHAGDHFQAHREVVLTP